MTTQFSHLISKQIRPYNPLNADSIKGKSEKRIVYFKESAKPNLSFDCLNLIQCKVNGLSVQLTDKEKHIRQEKRKRFLAWCNGIQDISLSPDSSIRMSYNHDMLESELFIESCATLLHSDSKLAYSGVARARKAKAESESIIEEKQVKTVFYGLDVLPEHKHKSGFSFDVLAEFLTDSITLYAIENAISIVNTPITNDYNTPIKAFLESDYNASIESKLFSSDSTIKVNDSDSVFIEHMKTNDARKARSMTSKEGKTENKFTISFVLDGKKALISTKRFVNITKTCPNGNEQFISALQSVKTIEKHIGEFSDTIKTHIQSAIDSVNGHKGEKIAVVLDKHYSLIVEGLDFIPSGETRTSALGKDSVIKSCYAYKLVRIFAHQKVSDSVIKGKGKGKGKK